MKKLHPITLTKKIGDIVVAGRTIDRWEEKGIKTPYFEQCWEIIAWFTEHISELVQSRISEFKVYESAREKTVAVGDDVKIPKHVVLDKSYGSIIIDDYAHIEPFVYIIGPAYIGKHAMIRSNARVGPGVSIGDYCKIGGEVEGSLFEPYSNKAHHGFIGHSYIGSWVNIGAGTTVSNLKNTYGAIRVEVEGDKVDTGMQFLGTVIGDFAKLSINTSVLGGRFIGVNAYASGSIDRHLESFRMNTPSGLEIVDIESAIATQKRMFERRGVSQTEADIQKIRKLFEECASARP